MSVPFFRKDNATIRAEMKGVLNAMGLGTLYEGGKAKAIMDGVADKLSDLYNSTFEAMLNVNPSTATSVWLDLIANSVTVTRFLAEGDDSLRGRVALNMGNLMMCNEDAITLRLRLHPRVKNITYQNFVYGAGSYAVFVEPIDGTNVDSQLISDLTTLATLASAHGTFVLVLGAKDRLFRMTATVRGTNVDTDAVASAIRAYINGLGLAGTMNIDELRAAAVSAGATGIDFHDIWVDNQRILPRDFPVAWDERVVVDRTVAQPILIAA